MTVRVDTVGPQGPAAQPVLLRAQAQGEWSFWWGEMGRRDDAVRRVCADIVRQVAGAYP